MADQPKQFITCHKDALSMPKTGKAYERRVKGVPGLSLRVSAVGTKLWEYRYTARGGGRRRMPLGLFPGISFKDAGDQARALRVEVDAGKDPVKAREAEAEKPEAKLRTMDEVAVAWLEAFSTPKHGGRLKRPKSPTSYRNEESRYRIHIKPKLGHRLVSEIDEDAVNDFMDTVTGGKLAPDTTLSIGRTLSGIMSYARKQGLIKTNPALGNVTTVEGRKRTGRLKDDAVTALWTVLTRPPQPSSGTRRYKLAKGDHGASPPVSLALRLLLLTMGRRAEVGAAKWDEFNFKDKEWVVPGARHKSRKDFLIPLQPEMLKILGEAAKLTHGQKAKLEDMKEGFVFPSPRVKGASITDYSLAQALGRILEDQGLDPATPHDFRRTSTTLLASRGGYTTQQIQLVLGHANGGHYNLHDYRKEKIEMLAKWESILREIITNAEQQKEAA